MKKSYQLLITVLLMCVAQNGWGQAPIFFEDFGDIPHGDVITTSNTNLTYVRLGTGGGSIRSSNPSALSTGASVLLTGSTTTSLNGIGITGADGFQDIETYNSSIVTFNFKIIPRSTSGQLVFSIGAGNTYTGDGTFNTGQMFVGFQINGSNLQRRTSSAWVTMTTVTSFELYEFKVVANKSGETIYYDENESVDDGKMNVYLNGIIIAENVDVTTSSVDYNAFRIYGVNSFNAAIDDIAIYDYAFPAIEAEPNDPNITLNTDEFNGNFGNVEAESFSDSSSFLFSAVNITDEEEEDEIVTVTAPTGFELSKDNSIWTSDPLTFEAVDGSIDDSTVYVRFAPTIADGEVYSGNITISSPGSGATERTIAVSGQEACVFPTSQVSALAAENETTNSVDINWTDPEEDAQVLIVIREGAEVNFTPVRGESYILDQDLGNGNTVAFVGDASTQIVSIGGLATFTTYHVQAFVFDDENNCYNTTSAPSIEFITEAGADSDSSIDAPNEQVTPKTLVSNSAIGEFEGVFNFDITDLGSGDELATIVNQVVIEAGPDNQADFSTRIADARLVNLFDAAVIAATVDITADKITFTIADGVLEVGDGTTVNLQLQIELDEILIDGEQIQFQIPESHSFEAILGGSVFALNVSEILGSVHTIDVVATGLVLNQSTIEFDINLNNKFTITVTAQDNFENIDTSARILSLALQSGSGNISPDENLTDQITIDGSFTWSNLSYSEQGNFIVEVTDGVFSVISDEFTTTEFIADFIETFDNSTITSSFSDGSFVGNDGIEWFFNQLRDVDSYPIDGNGAIIRRASDALLYTGPISGGIETLAFEFRKAYTGSASRQLEVTINLGQIDEKVFLTEEIPAFSGLSDTIYIFKH